MKLDWSIQRHVSALSKDAERFENTDGARAVVICAGGRQKREQVVHGVLMRTEDSQWRGKVDNFGLETSNNRWLRKFVRENVERDVRVKRSGLDNLVASC